MSGIRVYQFLIQVVAGAILLLPSLALAQYTSKPLDPKYYADAPMRYTGASYTVAGACSGAVVADTRVMLSASHCVFKTDLANPWTASPEWFLRYASATSPVPGQGKRTRGYWYFASYTDAVRQHTMSSFEAFDLDYMAVYSYAPLAEEAAPYVLDGYGAILTLPWKQTLGYPSGLYKTDNPYKYYMHFNGPWTAQCDTPLGSYVQCNEVSTGPGNSGGPVFVWDPQSSLYYYAGVLVGGFSRSLGYDTDVSGINAMAQDEWALVNSAIDSANKELPDDRNTGAVDGGTTPGASNGQRLIVYGNNSLIEPGQRATYRVDMTDFGSVTGSRTINRTFTLVNSGTTMLRFDIRTPVHLSGKGARYFKIRNQLQQGLAPNQAQSLKIAFRASPRGRHRATVVLKSDDPQTPAYRFLIQAQRR
jgi:hypothetical protein